MSVSAVSNAASRASSSSSNPVLRQGASGAAVKQMQQLIKNAGYSLDVDGSFGPKTLAALKKFQAAKGLDVDGVCGPKTWGALKGTSSSASSSASSASSSSSPVLRQGASGAAVRQMQQLIKSAGYSLDVDGSFGPKTLSTLKKFQAAKGLSADGICGPKTWSALRSSDGFDAAPVAQASSGSGSQPVLRQGAKGDAVKRMQQLIKSAGISLSVDGSFGPATAAALCTYQATRGLTADGICGPATWRALTSNAPAVSSGNVRTVTGYVSGRAQTITVTPVGYGEYLRTDAAAAYQRMVAAAAADGITLKAVSGFRSYEEQAALYRAYQNGTGNLAARPGYSNHQSGISMDISTGSYSSSAYKWLKANASRYGFVNDVSGEHWHWTYKR